MYYAEICQKQLPCINGLFIVVQIYFNLVVLMISVDFCTFLMIAVFHRKEPETSQRLQSGSRARQGVVYHSACLLRFHRRGLHERFQGKGESRTTKEAHEESKVSQRFQVFSI